MAREKTNSVFAVGLFFVFLGCIFNIVGDFTSGWLEGFGFNMGIFDGCPTAGICTVSDSLVIVRGTAIAGIVLSLLALLLFLVFLCMTCRGRTPSHKIAVAGGVFAFIAGGCIEIGIIVFALNVYDPTVIGLDDYLAMYFGYSFILCVVGTVFIFGGGVVGWLGARKQVIARNPPQAFVLSGGALTVPYISHTQTGVVMQGQQVFYQYQPNQNMHAMPTYPAGQSPAQPLDLPPSYTPSQYSTPATNQGFQQLQAPPLYAPRESKQVPLN